MSTGCQKVSQTDRKINTVRQADRVTERQSDRETEGQRDRMSPKNQNLPQRTKWFLEPLGSFGPLNYSIAFYLVIIGIKTLNCLPIPIYFCS